MGWNRDKAQDLLNTQKVLNNKIAAVSGGTDWLGHTAGKGDFAVNQVLLHGGTVAELKKARRTWRNHVAHLRSEHGLEVEPDVNKIWRFTGQAAEGKKNHTKTPISDSQYRAGYVWGRKVTLEDADKKTATEELVELGINETSASYMLVVAEGLLSGKIFKRALKEEAYGWYLGWILDDLGPDALRSALQAARLHLDYRESEGNTLPRFRADIEAFEIRLNGKTLAEDSAADGDANLSDARAARERWAKVLARYGQPEFRRKLMSAYKRRCAVTGTTIERVLEAAHVKPYSDKGENKVSNGLLLRSDIHALFDAYLLSIDPETYKIKISQSIKDVEEYWKLDGIQIRRPDDQSLWPDKVELARHYGMLV